VGVDQAPAVAPEGNAIGAAAALVGSDRGSRAVADWAAASAVGLPVATGSNEWMPLAVAPVTATGHPTAKGGHESSSRAAAAATSGRPAGTEDLERTHSSAAVSATKGADAPTGSNKARRHRGRRDTSFSGVSASGAFAAATFAAATEAASAAAATVTASAPAGTPPSAPSHGVTHARDHLGRCSRGASRFLRRLGSGGGRRGPARSASADGAAAAAGVTGAGFICDNRGSPSAGGSSGGGDVGGGSSSGGDGGGGSGGGDSSGGLVAESAGGDKLGKDSSGEVREVAAPQGDPPPYGDEVGRAGGDPPPSQDESPPRKPTASGGTGRRVEEAAPPGPASDEGGEPARASSVPKGVVSMPVTGSDNGGVAAADGAPARKQGNAAESSFDAPLPLPLTPPRAAATAVATVPPPHPTSSPALLSPPPFAAAIDQHLRTGSALPPRRAAQTPPAPPAKAAGCSTLPDDRGAIELTSPTPALANETIVPAPTLHDAAEAVQADAAAAPPSALQPSAPAHELVGLPPLLSVDDGAHAHAARSPPAFAGPLLRTATPPPYLHAPRSATAARRSVWAGVTAGALWEEALPSPPVTPPSTPPTSLRGVALPRPLAAAPPRAAPGLAEEMAAIDAATPLSVPLPTVVAPAAADPASEAPSREVEVASSPASSPPPPRPHPPPPLVSPAPVTMAVPAVPHGVHASDPPPPSPDTMHPLPTSPLDTAAFPSNSPPRSPLAAARSRLRWHDVEGPPISPPAPPPHSPPSNAAATTAGGRDANASEATPGASGSFRSLSLLRRRRLRRSDERSPPREEGGGGRGERRRGRRRRSRRRSPSPPERAAVTRESAPRSASSPSGREVRGASAAVGGRALRPSLSDGDASSPPPSHAGVGGASSSTAALAVPTASGGEATSLEAARRAHGLPPVEVDERDPARWIGGAPSHRGGARAMTSALAPSSGGVASRTSGDTATTSSEQPPVGRGGAPANVTIADGRELTEDHTEAVLAVDRHQSGLAPPFAKAPTVAAHPPSALASSPRTVSPPLQTPARPPPLESVIAAAASSSSRKLTTEPPSLAMPPLAPISTYTPGLSTTAPPSQPATRTSAETPTITSSVEGLVGAMRGHLDAVEERANGDIAAAVRLLAALAGVIAPVCPAGRSIAPPPAGRDATAMLLSIGGVYTVVDTAASVVGASAAATADALAILVAAARSSRRVWDDAEAVLAVALLGMRRHAGGGGGAGGAAARIDRGGVALLRAAVNAAKSDDGGGAGLPLQCLTPRERGEAVEGVAAAVYGALASRGTELQVAVDGLTVLVSLCEAATAAGQAGDRVITAVLGGLHATAAVTRIVAAGRTLVTALTGGVDSVATDGSADCERSGGSRPSTASSSRGRLSARAGKSGDGVSGVEASAPVVKPRRRRGKSLTRRRTSKGGLAADMPAAEPVCAAASGALSTSPLPAGRTGHASPVDGELGKSAPSVVPAHSPPPPPAATPHPRLPHFDVDPVHLLARTLRLATAVVIHGDAATAGAAADSVVAASATAVAVRQAAGVGGLAVGALRLCTHKSGLWHGSVGTAAAGESGDKEDASVVTDPPSPADWNNGTRPSSASLASSTATTVATADIGRSDKRRRVLLAAATGFLAALVTDSDGRAAVAAADGVGALLDGLADATCGALPARAKKVGVTAEK